MPNHQIPIVEPTGIEQSTAAGQVLAKNIRLAEALLYQSPYKRTRQTMHYLLKGAGFEGDMPKVYEDPRLREVDFGYGDPEAQKGKRDAEGYFWYRFDGGESAADCFDRVATFLDSMMRQVRRKPIYRGSVRVIDADTGKVVGENRNVVIVSHGLIIRCFVMRFMHLSVEQFDTTDTPNNCDIVTIGHKKDIEFPQFVSGNWAVSGLKIRSKS